LKIIDQIKHKIKHASVLKKSSFYRQSLAILNTIQA